MVEPNKLSESIIILLDLNHEEALRQTLFSWDKFFRSCGDDLHSEGIWLIWDHCIYLSTLKTSKLPHFIHMLSCFSSDYENVMKLLQIKTLLYIHVKTNTIEFIDLNMHACISTNHPHRFLSDWRSYWSTISLVSSNTAGNYNAENTVIGRAARRKRERRSDMANGCNGLKITFTWWKTSISERWSPLGLYLAIGQTKPFILSIPKSTP
jgi:hypothetical protein